MRQFLSAKWIVSHVFVLAMIVLMVALGFWQLDRLDQRRAENADVRIAMAAEPLDFREVFSARTTEPLDHTPVTVTGEYLDDQSFLVANRTFESQAGSWLVTPVQRDDGTMIIVSRGWVPRTWTVGDDVRVIETPSGPVEIEGRIRGSVGGGRIGTGDSAVLPEISRLDLAKVEELLGVEVQDRWVQLVQQDPPLDEIPVPVPPPDLDDGPHLAYAFQWFFFSAGTVVAYFLILRNRHSDVSTGAE